MSYSPLITAAKREAKRRSVDNGSSYQSELQQIAKEAGKEDWPAYVSDPVAISFDGASLPGRDFKKVLTKIMILVVGVAALFIIILFQAIKLEQEYVSKSFMNNEEKAISAVLPKLSLVDRERLVYISAWKTEENKRKVYFILFDWRSLDRFSLFKFFEKFKLYIKGEDWPYPEIPVVRLQAEVTCDTNEITNIEMHSAEDTVSDSIEILGGNDGEVLLLNPEETSVVCSEDTLRRTKEVEKLREPI